MVGSCKGDGQNSAGAIDLHLDDNTTDFNGSSVTISGTVSTPANGTKVRVCVNDLPVGAPQAADASGSTFTRSGI